MSAGPRRTVRHLRLGDRAALIITGTESPGECVQGRMSVRRFAVLLAASAAFAVSGCAGNASSPGSTAPPSSPGSTAPPSSPGSTASPTPAGSSLPASSAPGGKPTAAAGETLSGTVVAGVEPGCLILQGAGRHHVLIFDDPALRSQAAVGSSITVSGQSRPAQVTTCQQGVPFVVTAVRAN